MSILHHKQNYHINQRCEDKINAVTMTKYQNHPSELIKHTFVLDQVIKSHGVNLYKIMSYNKCTVFKSMHAY